MLPKAELSIRRNLLLGGADLRYSLGANTTIDLVKLLNEGWRRLAGYTEGQAIADIKGRDAANTIQDFGGIELVRPNELLFARGVVRVEDDEVSIGSTASKREAHAPELIVDEKIERQPFTFAALTDFHEFEGVHHIIHRVNFERSETLLHLGSLPATPETLTSLPGCTIDLVRFGFDFFDTNFLTLVGFAPVVTQTVLIEAHPDSFCLRIDAERQRPARAAPLQRNDFMQRLSDLIKEILNFDLAADYAARLEK